MFKLILIVFSLFTCFSHLYSLLYMCQEILSSPHPRHNYAAALQFEYDGLDQLVQDTAFLSPLSHDLVVGHIAIEDLLKVVKSSSLDGGDVIGDHLTALRDDAKDTAYNLQALQIKVDGAIDR